MEERMGSWRPRKEHQSASLVIILSDELPEVYERRETRAAERNSTHAEQSSERTKSGAGMMVVNSQENSLSNFPH